MTENAKHDAWSAGDSYDAYMGRWSKKIAVRFLDWLNAGEHLDWLDVGCGTGSFIHDFEPMQSPKSYWHRAVRRFCRDGTTKRQ